MYPIFMARTWRLPDTCEITITGVPKSLRVQINRIAKVYKGINRNALLKTMLFDLAAKYEAEQKERLQQ
jgi:hypothetical protein